MLDLSYPRRDWSVKAFVGLGSNLGDSVGTIVCAAQLLCKAPGIKLLRCSPLYRTAPVLAIGHDFINAVLSIECELSAVDLLLLAQQIENHFGRQRTFVNAPRTLDIDLLFYGQATIQSKHLTLPHPRWLDRAFVLLPLKAIAPELVSKEMLEKVSEQRVELLN
jgi:2-amino-4-hydroxy-6-hydroxymethyldihydropteridine diphosphokinase